MARPDLVALAKALEKQASQEPDKLLRAAKLRKATKLRVLAAAPAAGQ